MGQKLTKINFPVWFFRLGQMLTLINILLNRVNFQKVALYPLTTPYKGV